MLGLAGPGRAAGALRVGRVVAAMSAAYTGEGKTDAKDAYVIAETRGCGATCRWSIR